MPAPLRTPETTHRIEPPDCDAAGHLRHARYLDYFFSARETQVAQHYAATLGQLARADEAGWTVTKVLLAYQRPVTCEETVLIRTQLIHFDNSSLVVEMLMLSEDGTRLKAVLWAEMAFVRTASATRTDHSDDLMDLLDRLDVESVNYDPDGFDDRVKQLRKQLKRDRQDS